MIDAALFAEIVGMVGVVFIVGCYFLISCGRMKGDDASYHIANLIGAVLILYSLAYSWNSASFVIEIVWIAISLYGLFRIWQKRRTQR